MSWKEILKADNDIEKLFGRKKQQQAQLTKDGITFQDQRALEVYNQNVSKYPQIKNALTGKTVNRSVIEMAIDNASRIKRDSERAIQQHQQRTKTTVRNQPNESAWRRPAY